MAKTLGNIRIFGEEASSVYVAPKGTTLPTDLAAPAAAFLELGWLGEDGIDVDREADFSDFYAMGGTIVRTIPVNAKNTFKFQALETTATTYGLYYPGLTKDTPAGGPTTMKIPGGAKADERAWVVDMIDGAITKRYAVGRGQASAGTLVHKTDEISVYEFTVTIQGGFSIITNDPAAA